MRLRLFCICLLAGLFGFAATPAHANQDYVQFGSKIHIAPGQMAHDTVCFFCGVEDQGTIQGDIVVFFGNVHISGQANHDVVTFFGNVTVDDNSSVGQDVVNFFGNAHLGENASVGKDMVSMFGSFRAAETASIGGNRVVQPGWLFWVPLLVIFLIIYVVIHEFRSYRRRQYLRGYPFPPRQ